MQTQAAMCKPGVLLKLSITIPVKHEMTKTIHGLILMGNNKIKTTYT
jgi:hypothetical protein